MNVHVLFAYIDNLISQFDHTTSVMLSLYKFIN